MNAITPPLFRDAFLAQLHSVGHQTVCDQYRGDSHGSFTEFMNDKVLPKVADQLGLFVKPEHVLKNRGRLDLLLRDSRQQPVIAVEHEANRSSSEREIRNLLNAPCQLGVLVVYLRPKSQLPRAVDKHNERIATQYAACDKAGGRQLLVIFGRPPDDKSPLDWSFYACTPPGRLTPLSGYMGEAAARSPG
jgi:hypothetical protein